MAGLREGYAIVTRPIRQLWHFTLGPNTPPLVRWVVGFLALIFFMRMLSLLKDPSAVDPESDPKVRQFIEELRKSSKCHLLHAHPEIVLHNEIYVPRNDDQNTRTSRRQERSVEERSLPHKLNDSIREIVGNRTKIIEKKISTANSQVVR